MENGLSSKEMLWFSDSVEMQGESENDAENISDGKKMTENVKNTRSKTIFASVEDPLDMHRTASNEKTLVSEIPNELMRKMLSLHQGKKKH